MALKCVLWHLKETQNFGLCYLNYSLISLSYLYGWSDADYAQYLDVQKSTSRYLFYLNSSLLNWHSKK